MEGVRSMPGSAVSNIQRKILFICHTLYLFLYYAVHVICWMQKKKLKDLAKNFGQQGINNRFFFHLFLSKI